MVELDTAAVITLFSSLLGGYLAGWNTSYLVAQTVYRQRTEKPMTSLWVRYVLVLAGMILIAAGLGQLWTTRPLPELVGYLGAVLVLVGLCLGYFLAKHRAHASTDRQRPTPLE